MKRKEPTADVIGERLIHAVGARLSQNKQVRRTLPIWGRVHIDRQLPFLCVYRRPIVGADDGFTELVTSEASYIFAPALRRLQAGLTALVRRIVDTLSEVYGACLLVELWPAPVALRADADPVAETPPGFRLLGTKDDDLDSLLEECARALRRTKVNKMAARVDVIRRERIAPVKLSPILPRAEAKALRCTVIGLEIDPVHLDRRTGESYPFILRDLEHQLTRALRQIFFNFARTRTTQRPRHYHGLGRRAVVKAVWEVDARLAEISSGFSFLLQVTPYNAARAWSRFRKSGFTQQPVFRYRPLPVDPVSLKRRLFATPIERLEDPALRALFRERQDELDRRLTMLLDINTPKFVHGSVQLYGPWDDRIDKLAVELLEKLPARSRVDSRQGYLPLADFVARAEAEVEYYRQQWPAVNSGVQVRNDTTGMMVSKGRLLISRDIRIPAARAEGLLQHEIGTHIVTYYNGRAQPFKQLSTGLAGYDALQEGLAVFAEFLVGAMTAPRLRVLAARVAAVRWLLDGASFLDTFHRLNRDYGFDKRTAFTVSMRVYRGGGFTKDAVYLKGLVDLLAYIAGGGNLDPLFVGKIAAEHVPVIEELIWRKVLTPPPLRPRYLDAPGVAERLERARAGLAPFDLIARPRAG